MTWFKVDDKHHDHRKTRKALRGVPGKRRDAGAIGLWDLAGSWCADNLTDGFVPADELSRWDDDWQTLAARLVDAGLWLHAVVDGEEGYRFHDWDDHQPSRSEVLRKRDEAKERMRRIRASRSGSGEVRANSEGTSPHVHDPVPTRPDPSPAAAAAGDDDAAAALPPAVEILRAALEAHRLNVRWDKLTAEQLDEITQLVDTHGDSALVRVAVAKFRPDRPAAFAQAWLGDWRAIPAPGTSLRAVPAPSCPEPGHSGTVRHCAQCASEQKAAR